MDDTFKFSLLTDGNYATWSKDVEYALRGKGCWSLVSNTEPKLSADATEKEKVDFQQRKDKALSILYYSVSIKYRTLISSEKEPFAVWNILKENFRSVSRASIMRLLDEFFSIRFDPNSENIGLFCARIKNAVQLLADAGHPVEELYQSFQAIRYLPPDYQNVVQLIYRWDDKEFKLCNIEKELITEEGRLNQLKIDLDKNASSSSAYNLCAEKYLTCDFKTPRFLNVNPCATRSGKNKKIDRNKRIGPCFKCKQFGHLKYQCKNLDINLQSQRGEGKPNVLDNLEQSYFISEAYFNAGEVTADKFIWVIDTAATKHFCNNLNLFTDIRKVQGTSMSLAVGDVESPVEGIGTVEMYVMIDGKKNIISLNDVMFSPKLRQSFICPEI